MKTMKSNAKHSRIYDALSRDIRHGRWQAGDRMPSEAELVDHFGVSRITVSRAMRDLQTAGLVERRRGSGTYLKRAGGGDSRSFGLLIPDLGETEIFEPICQGMMASPLASQHVLLWGNSCTAAQSKEGSSAKGACAWRLCRQFIERKVSGVFFAPLEQLPDKDELNRKIGHALDQAGIPVLLLDRPLLPFPAASRHDLVGIDNRRAGYVITEHLLRLGCRCIRFVGMPGSASTVDDREAGFREALHMSGAPTARSFAERFDPSDLDRVGNMMTTDRPDGIVCANDRTAGALMHSLRRLDYRIPGDVRLVGIDDVEYASLLPVPLTTLRQPTRRIGEVALAMLLERMEQPDLPPRDTRLQCDLVIRESCGASDINSDK